MKDRVPCTNIGKLGGLNCICSMSCALGRLPYLYCEMRKEGKASGGLWPALNFVGSANAPLTSIVWRIFMPVSEMLGLNTFAVLPNARSLPAIGTRTSTKSDVLLQVWFAGHCSCPAVLSSRLS